jgi:hypothetical protein
VTSTCGKGIRPEGGDRLLDGGIRGIQLLFIVAPKVALAGSGNLERSL